MKRTLRALQAPPLDPDLHHADELSVGHHDDRVAHHDGYEASKAQPSLGYHSSYDGRERDTGRYERLALPPPPTATASGPLSLYPSLHSSLAIRPDPPSLSYSSSSSSSSIVPQPRPTKYCYLPSSPSPAVPTSRPPPPLHPRDTEGGDERLLRAALPVAPSARSLSLTTAGRVDVIEAPPAREEEWDSPHPPPPQRQLEGPATKRARTTLELITEKCVPALVQKYTRLDDWQAATSARVDVLDLFPFPKVVLPESGVRSPLPLSLLANPTLLGVVNSPSDQGEGREKEAEGEGDGSDPTDSRERRLRSHRSHLRALGQAVLIPLDDAGNISPAGALGLEVASNLPQVVESLRDHTLAAAEQAITLVHQKIQAIHEATGLITPPDTLERSVGAMVRAAAGPDYHRIPLFNPAALASLPSEDARRAAERAINDSRAADRLLTDRLHAQEAALQDARNAATRTILQGVAAYLDAYDRLRASQVEVATDLLCNGFDALTRLRDIEAACRGVRGSHRLPLDIWCDARGVADRACRLTSLRIDSPQDCPHLERAGILLTSAGSTTTSSARGVVLYAPLLEELLHRALFGAPLRGGWPPLPARVVGRRVGAAAVPTLPDPTQEGLTLWRTPREEGEGRERPPTLVVTGAEVLKVAGDDKFNPWWTFARTFPLPPPPTASVPDERTFLGLAERMLAHHLPAHRRDAHLGGLITLHGRLRSLGAPPTPGTVAADLHAWRSTDPQGGVALPGRGPYPRGWNRPYCGWWEAYRALQEAAWAIFREAMDHRHPTCPLLLCAGGGQ